MLPTTVIARENTGISAGADVRHSCCTFATMVCAKNQWLWMGPGGVQKLNWNLIRLSRRFKIEYVYSDSEYFTTSPRFRTQFSNFVAYKRASALKMS